MTHRNDSLKRRLLVALTLKCFHVTKMFARLHSEETWTVISVTVHDNVTKIVHEDLECFVRNVVSETLSVCYF